MSRKRVQKLSSCKRYWIRFLVAVIKQDFCLVYLYIEQPIFILFYCSIAKHVQLLCACTFNYNYCFANGKNLDILYVTLVWYDCQLDICDLRVFQFHKIDRRWKHLVILHNMPKLSSAANAKFADFLFCSISLDRKTPLFLYFLTLTHISRDRGAGLKGGGLKRDILRRRQGKILGGPGACSTRTFLNF